MSRARVSVDADGAVAFDDPACPFTTRVWVTTTPRAHVRRLVVDSRAGLDITAARLHRLPMAQMRYVAVAQAGPNEALYGMLASPRPPTGWGDDHWPTVLAVWERGEWAQVCARGVTVLLWGPIPIGGGGSFATT